MSLDHESATARPWPQPRQPAGWKGRRPRPLFPTAVVHDLPRPGGGSGDQTRSARGRLSECGLGAEAPSQGPPDPLRTAALEDGGIARRPAPAASLTERASPLAEMSPPLFDWPRSGERTSIGTGRGLLLGTAAPFRGTGPPESACVLGAARLWPWGQESRPPRIDESGRRPMAFAAAAMTPEKRRQRNAKNPVAVENIFS